MALTGRPEAKFGSLNASSYDTNKEKPYQQKAKKLIDKCVKPLNSAIVVSMYYEER